MAFDPQAMMNAALTPEGAKGLKVLTPAGDKGVCVIESVEAKEPFEDQRDKLACVYFLQLRTEAGDLIYSKVNASHSVAAGAPHSKSIFFKLCKALWPDDAERVGKTPQDWVGERVRVIVEHGEFNGKPCEEFLYMHAG